jgi:DNA/RNA endonuclease YhcR with UshA esterase domain
MRLLIGSCFLICVAAAPAADDSKPIGPAEALKKIDETVTVRMEVKSARLTGTACYLNSESDYKSEKNLTLYIDKASLAKFKNAKIEDPADHFKGKTVEVKGKVIKFRERAEIKVGSPGAIKVVEKKEEEKKHGGQ